MSRNVVMVSALLLAVSFGLFAWKTTVLDLPIRPEGAQGLWRVELELSVRGTGGRGSVRIPLPTSGPGQAVFDERSASDRLLFTIRNEGGQRVGVWSGRFDGVHQLVQGFRVQLAPVHVPVADEGMLPTQSLLERYGVANSDVLEGTPAVTELFDRLSLPPVDDPEGRLRSIFAFVADEIATQETGADDALLTLAAREGSETGKTRALVMLLQHAGIPAQNVLGLQLRPGLQPTDLSWAQAWIGDRWVPLSPVEGLFGVRPADRVALSFDGREAIESSGVQAVGRRYHAIREDLRPDELAALMVPRSEMFGALSLYRLPLSTQAALRALLVLPIGALIVALFRNFIGIPTFGTFMPILLAFALRDYSLLSGLALVGVVLSVGVVGRLALGGLHLLLVPRLAILLCMVVLLVTGSAVVARGFVVRDLYAGVLFPLVILTMLIERFTVALAEEGWRPTLERVFWSIVVAGTVHPVLRSADLQQLMFGFPELVLGVMGALVLLGGYTGYRVMDLIRFRAFARFEASP